MKRLALLLPLLALAACCRSVERPSSLTEFPNEFHILPPVTGIGTVVSPVKDERIPVVRILDKESEHILLVNPQRGGWFRSPSMEVWHDQWKDNIGEQECRLIGRFDLEQGKVIHIDDKLSRAESFDQAVFSFTINSSDEVVLYWNHAQIPSVSTNLVSGFRRFVFNSTPAQSGYFCLDEILDERSPSPTNSPAAPEPHAEAAETAPRAESAEAATNGVLSPIAMRDVMASRTPGERGKALARYGSAGGDATVMRALRWLRTVQCEDGSWPGHPVASTALALWCYFDHNETPLDADEPEFARTTFRGLRFLAGDLDPETGLFRSARGEPLAQPLGALALAMGYETTFGALPDLSLRPILREAAESALRPILAGQRPDGAWNADPLDPSPEGRGDPRATVWCTLALRGGRIWTHDLASAPEWQRRAGDALAAFLDPAADAALRPDGAATPVTAAAVFGLQRLGRYNDPAARRGIDALVGCVYSWEAWDGPQPWGGSGAPVRDWAFVTNARFECGGRTFGEWNKQFLPEACGRQRVVPADESGYRDLAGKLRPIGWWDSPSETEAGLCSGGPVLPCERWRGGARLDGETTLGDRVRDTCLSAIPMMVYYAFLPSYLMSDVSDPLSLATNAPAPHAESAEGAKEPAP